MKKLFAIAAMLCISFVYGQDKINTDYNSSISMEPTNVVSSAILNFNYTGIDNVKYVVLKNNEEVYSKEITKGSGSQVFKVDFSSLEKGSYTIRFIVDNEEVKNISFEKI